MGGLTAEREAEGHDVIAHISSHTVWLRARGVCVSVHQCGSVESQAKCVCVMLRAYSHSHPQQ